MEKMTSRMEKFIREYRNTDKTIVVDIHVTHRDDILNTYLDFETDVVSKNEFHIAEMRTGCDIMVEIHEFDDEPDNYIIYITEDITVEDIIEFFVVKFSWYYK